MIKSDRESEHEVISADRLECSAMKCSHTGVPSSMTSSHSLTGPGISDR